MTKTIKPLEIFRTVTHTGASGEDLDFSGSVVKQVADSYDPQLSQAPIVVGHPRSDAPAYGWVSDLDFNDQDGVLRATPGQVDPEFAEMVVAGRFKFISASFIKPDSPNT